MVGTVVILMAVCGAVIVLAVYGDARETFKGILSFFDLLGKAVSSVDYKSCCEAWLYLFKIITSPIWWPLRLLSRIILWPYRFNKATEALRNMTMAGFGNPWFRGLYCPNCGENARDPEIVTLLCVLQCKYCGQKLKYRP